MTRDDDTTERLRREITRAIVLGTGTREQVAMPFANAVVAYLQEQFAGRQFYVPSRPRQYDVLQIQAALARGTSRKQVCAEFNISRRTLARLVPEEPARKRRRRGGC